MTQANAQTPAQLNPLSVTEKLALRGQAQGLKPVVIVGDDGLKPTIIHEVKRALEIHGLIKVRVMGDDREARHALYAELCDRCNAHPVQAIGKLLVLFGESEKYSRDGLEHGDAAVGLESPAQRKAALIAAATAAKIKAAKEGGVYTSKKLAAVGKKATPLKDRKAAQKEEKVEEYGAQTRFTDARMLGKRLLATGAFGSPYVDNQRPARPSTRSAAVKAAAKVAYKKR